MQPSRVPPGVIKKTARQELRRAHRRVAHELGVRAREVRAALKKGRRGWWWDLSHSKTKLLIKMCRRRETLEEMGKVLGCSHPLVAYIRSVLVREVGPDIFRPADPLYLTHEAARELDIPTSLVQGICRQGGIEFFHTRGKGDFVLTERLLEALRQHPQVIEFKAREKQAQVKTCAICSREFTPAPLRQRSKTCSPECNKEYQRRRQYVYLDRPINPDSLRGWRRELYFRLSNHRLLDGEEWVTMKEALRISGLSPMQLVWLRRRGIIQPRAHPTLRWSPDRRKSVSTFARSELEVVRQVVEGYQGQGS